MRSPLSGSGRPGRLQPPPTAARPGWPSATRVLYRPILAGRFAISSRSSPSFVCSHQARRAKRAPPSGCCAIESLRQAPRLLPRLQAAVRGGGVAVRSIVLDVQVPPLDPAAPPPDPAAPRLDLLQVPPLNAVQVPPLDPEAPLLDPLQVPPLDPEAPLLDPLQVPPLDPEASRPKAVGWSVNSAGKPGPRMMDLSRQMKPEALAEASVDLNLRLMRWRLMPALNNEAVAGTRGLLIAS